ncbi:GNAT family N-acetyltransferase [bacterium]|nr:GNAT family N-acetyltransferase [bacterium]
MIKLQGNGLYLAALDREYCQKLWDDYEYDFINMTEPLYIGKSRSSADDWFEELKKQQGNVQIRLGIFLPDNSIIGDIALQEIDWKNRSCSIGLSISKIENRSKGYGSEALRVLLEYAFLNIGLERIYAETLEQNKPAIKSLEKCNFVFEGKERKAVYLAGKRWDRLRYSILIEEYKDPAK